jgi:protein subunit release factor A
MKINISVTYPESNVWSDDLLRAFERYAIKYGLAEKVNDVAKNVMADMFDEFHQKVLDETTNSCCMYDL